jgi:DNA polymerase beta
MDIGAATVVVQDYKGTIINALNTMRRKEIADKQRFKAAAYKKVIDQIEILPAVKSMNDVKGVTGIGQKIYDKLSEIFETGTLKSAERARAEKQLDIYDRLLSVHGIGPAKARQLIEAGIKDIPGLRTALDKNPRLLSNIQKAGLKYYEEINERIPRDEIILHDELVTKIFRDAGLESTIVGSYRRGLPTSGDIDILVTGDQESFIKGLINLHKINYIIETLAEGATKGLYITKISPKMPARRVDILYTPPDEYPYAILYFTGSKDFNVGMRRWAIEKGYTLNEHCLTKISTGEPVYGLASEENIFDFLGLKYIPPVERKDASQLVTKPQATPVKKATPRIIRIPEKIQSQLKDYTMPIGKRQLGDDDTEYYFTRPASAAGDQSTLKVRISIAHGANSEIGAKGVNLLPFTDLDLKRFSFITGKRLS